MNKHNRASAIAQSTKTHRALTREQSKVKDGAVVKSGRTNKIYTVVGAPNRNRSVYQLADEKSNNLFMSKIDFRIARMQVIKEAE